MDMNNPSEDSYTSQIQVRDRFSRLVEDVLTVEPDIIKMLDTFINESNKLDDCVVAKYGGRCWNYHFRNNTKLDDLEKSCVSSGNFDIFFSTTNPNFFKNEFYSNIIKMLGNIQSLFERGMSKIPNADFSKYYKITIGNEVDTRDRTILPDSIIWFINIELREKVKYENVPENYKILKRDHAENTLNGLFYFEIGIKRGDNNFRLFKELLIEKQDDSRKKDTTYLSLVGLYVISLFLEHTRKDKGIPIDEIRYKVFIKYKQDFFIHQLKQPSIEDAIIQIVFTTIPYLFGTDPYYVNKQSIIFTRSLELYEAKVHDPSINTTLNYKEYFNHLNSKVLLDSAGGGNGDPTLPSLRQILQWLFICIERSEREYRLEESGGDAIRHYLFDDIRETTDIDSKLFYYRTLNKNTMAILRNKIVKTLFFVLEYIHNYNYFRFSHTVDVHFGSYVFTANLNSLNQERTAKIRVLLDFYVPLVSLDARIKVYFSNKTGNMNGRGIFETYYNFAPLDIAFIALNKKQEIQQKKIPRITTFTSADPQYTVQGFKRENSENEYYLTPEPSLKYLIDDVEMLVNNKIRIMQGKNTKDQFRYNKLLALQNANKTEIDVKTYGDLEQLNIIKRGSEVEKKTEDFIHFITTIYNEPEEKLNHKLNYFFSLVPSIEWLNTETYDSVISNYKYFVRTLNHERRFTSGFGNDYYENVAIVKKGQTKLQINLGKRKSNSKTGKRNQSKTGSHKRTRKRSRKPTFEKNEDPIDPNFKEPSPERTLISV